MLLSVLINVAVAAVKTLLPGSADIPSQAAQLVRDLIASGKVPPLTHDDGRPITLAEADALVDAQAAAAHAALHAGDLPVDGGAVGGTVG